MLISFDGDLGRPLTTWDKSAITSSTSVLALIFSPLAGVFADLLGRKVVLGVASLFFVAGALLQAASGHVWMMITGRSIVGAAVGLASSVAPLYIAECAPADARGRLVTVQSLFITGGQVVAYVVGWAAQGHWRWAVGLGALPATMQAGLLLAMDESPRWLVRRAREGEARHVLSRLGMSLRESDRLVTAIRDVVLEEDATLGKHGLKESLVELVSEPVSRRALIVACMLQGLQQLCGFNSLMYFSATIFTLAGFTSPLTTSLSIALTNFLMTLVAFHIIDDIGRRRILLVSIPFMTLGLLACALSFSHINLSNSSPAIIATSASPSASTYSSLLLLSLLLYVAAYAPSLGTIPWHQGELFPSSATRGLGCGIATTVNWLANAVTAATFLPLFGDGRGGGGGGGGAEKRLLGGPGVVFVGYALVCAVGWVWIWWIFPESKGVGLEDVGGAGGGGGQGADGEDGL
ncbi:hypothetical protein AAFC00_003665 [Neodothiora populina]